jgi:transcriptional regulator with XRE-family HTH domain
VTRSHPLMARQTLGRELRRVRDDAGLSGPQLAAATGISQPKISRLEQGQHRPKIPDVEAWLDACRVPPDERARLMQLARDAQTEITGLRALLRGSIATRAREFLAMDAATRQVRQFQPYIVPGIAHTEEYAAGCIVAANLTGEPDIDSAVELRMRRGDRFREPDAPAYHMVVTEAALRFRPAVDEPDRVIAGTLRKLLDTARAPNITFQVIRAEAPMTALPQCAFSIFDWANTEDPTLAQIETPAGEVTYTDPDDVAGFEIVWRRMCAAASTPDESIAFLQQLVAQDPT